METKINIAELLKDCPTGIELDSTIVNGLYFDEVTFDEVTENNLIKCYTKFNSTYNTIYFYSDGSYLNHTCSKCVIFPKGKTTWEGFVPSCKFDITTLKPFDKVLVRDNDEQMWTTDIFSFYNEKHVYHFMCVGHYTNQCVPYEQNKHLLGTTSDCDEFYKIWE